MPNKIGFFTRKELKDGPAASSKKPGDLAHMSDERLWKLGPQILKSMNADAVNPEMEPAGTSTPDVYILGESPGLQADERNEQFAGKARRLLMDSIPRKSHKRIRWNNCCRTRTPGDRVPSRIEVECFRPSVVADIEKTKPKAIIATGPIAAAWFIGSGYSQTLLRGRRFPVQVGSHQCWMYPVQHPNHILRIEKGRTDGVPGEEWKNAFKRDVARVFKEIDSIVDPTIVDPETHFDGIDIASGHKQGDFDKAMRHIAWATEEPITTFDIETNVKRPYVKDARILCVAIGTELKSLAFALDHSRDGWDARQRKALREALRGYLLSTTLKTAHNLAFELEWFGKLIGQEILWSSDWADTMSQAYCLDERVGGFGLDFLTLSRFGFNLKKVCNLDRKKLESYDIDKVLRYCALDVKYQDKLFYAQSEDITAYGLDDICDDQVRRIPACVAAQLNGIPINQDVVLEFEGDYQKQIKALESEIAATKEVIAYRKRFGEFSPSSPKQVEVLLRDVMGRKEGKRGNKYSVDKTVLAAIGGAICEMIGEHRSLTKMLSTYIGPLKHDGSAESVIWHDGLLHTNFNTVFTRSGRLSSDGPNLQNWPKRNKVLKRIRKAFGAILNHSVISADFGQLEARVIAMLSLDPYMLDAMWTDFDVHMYWTEKILKVWPKTCKDRYGSLKPKAVKAFRGDVKNQHTFPCYYGADSNPNARSLEMPIDVYKPLYDEFWHDHRVLRGWQTEQRERYHECFYVQYPTGRRRRGPISENMVINTVSQGSGSDIVVDAMTRLSRRAFETQSAWLQPRINIHDDLTFITPNNKLEDAVITIAEIMSMTTYKWAKSVPLSVEVEVGDNWHDLEEIGTFSSRDFGHKRAA